MFTSLQRKWDQQTASSSQRLQKIVNSRLHFIKNSSHYWGYFSTYPFQSPGFGFRANFCMFILVMRELYSSNLALCDVICGIETHFQLTSCSGPFKIGDTSCLVVLRSFTLSLLFQFWGFWSWHSLHFIAWLIFDKESNARFSLLSPW